MTWARESGGVILVLLGVVWIGQGLNLLRGSGMSGHSLYAVIGLVVAIAGVWLLSEPHPHRPARRRIA